MKHRGLCDILRLAVEVGGVVAYFIRVIDVLGICDLSADLTTAVNDKCIDSCSSCFVPTLKVKVLLR